VYLPRSRARLHARKAEPAALTRVAQVLELNRSGALRKVRSARNRCCLRDF
jgi:hypothetical protein